MKLTYYLITTIFLCDICLADGLPGEYMKPRDEFFQGARQTGMGGIGYSMPDNENVMFLNPAGLGIKNHRYNNMAIAYGNMIVNTFNGLFLMQDHYIPICIQPSENNVGGFGIQLEHFSLISKEDIEETFWNEQTQTIQKTGALFNDNHLLNLGIISYGRNFSFWNAENHALGISLMVRSMYETNFGDPVAEVSLCADVGYTGSFDNGIHIGLVAKKIPLVRSFDRDGLMITAPVSVIPALGLYKDILKKSERTLLSLFTEINYKISIEKYEYYSFKEMKNGIGYNKSHSFSGGFELGLKEFLFLRNGCRLFFGDGFAYNKMEIASGIGIDIMDHFALNIKEIGSARKDLEAHSVSTI